MKTLNTIREFLWKDETENRRCDCGMVAQMTGQHRCKPKTTETEDREQYLRNLSNLAFAGSIRW